MLSNLLVRFNVLGQFLAHFVAVEGTVEGSEEEHDNLCAHTDEEHDVAALNMCEFEQGTQDNDGCTPTVCVIEESLSWYAVHPVLEASDDIDFSGHIYSNI